MNAIRKKTVLMMPAACGMGHAMRCVCLGKALQEKGYDVAFSASSKILDFINNHGFDQLYEVKDDAWKAVSIEEIGEIATDKGDIDKILNEELKIIDKIHPKLIISDFRITPRFSSYLRSVPWVSIVSHAYFLKNKRGLLNPVLKKAGLEKWILEIDDISKSIAKRVKWLFEKHDLEFINDWPQMTISPECAFIPSIPELEGIDVLPDKVHFVGPLSTYLHQPKINNEIGIQEYFSKFGISVSQYEKFLYVCLNAPIGDEYFKRTKDKIITDIKNAFIGTDWKVLIIDKTISDITSENNVFSLPFVPNELIYKLRKVIAITNGASVKNLEMTYNMIPIINIPVSSENILNSFLLADNNGCRVIMPEQVSTQRIKDEVEMLFVDHSYRKSIEDLSKKIYKYISPDISVNYLLNYGFIKGD